MKYLTCLLAIAILISTQTLLAQSGTTSFGKTVIGVDYEVGCTMGESIILNYISSNNYLSSGIIQPISGGNPVLALSTTLFSVRAIDKDVTIDWTTIQDFDQDYFLIERRFDKDQEFKTINRVTASEEVGSVSYSVTDFDILKAGVYYYRLKIFNKNGAFVYSEIRPVLFSLDKYLSTDIFPNPTSSHIKIQSLGVDIIGYELFSVDGKKVSYGQLKSNSINLSTLIAGIYILKLRSTQEEFFKVIQKTNI